MYQIFNPCPEDINMSVNGGRRVVIFVWLFLQQVVIDLLCSRHYLRCWDAAGQARSLLSSDVSSGTVQRQKACSGPQYSQSNCWY